ncbi:hypothetical protein LOD99_6614 [Oopsacas minuta]|uniref:Uncharacterized protein n=1 Tax=Oopsacas minuta TaxID=111878 RepID=A0AAV7JMJ1_9METZ|nr:hypothetical protein LOD99_6614 [Oopsacas minuta]
MNFNILIIVIIFAIPTAKSCGYNIIWDRDFCEDTAENRLSTSFLPPNSLDQLCEFEIGSNITLEHLNRNNYENLFRVRDRDDLISCSSINSTSDLVIISDSYTFNIDSENFRFGEEVYFISTSNGSKHAAENNRKIHPPCLQLAFRVINSANECIVTENCMRSSILTDNTNDTFGCSGLSMNVLLIIYIGVPLLIICIVATLVGAIFFSSRSRRMLIQQSFHKEKTEVTDVEM